jgi:DNA-binding LytR/AlgR family response regulator
MLLTTIIVEDEPIAAEVLRGYVAQIPELDCLGVFNDAEQAYEFLRSNQVVDVLLLDIQMPGMSGIDLLKQLKYKPKIIFTTAYRDYALQAYELQVVDYLLKPISFERFLTAVNRLIQPIFQAKLALEQVMQNQEFYFFSVGKRSVKIILDEILYIESMNDAAYVRTAAASYETKYPLSELEQMLPSDRFVRIHRSYIVQTRMATLTAVNEITIGTRKLPIGRSYKGNVLGMFL